MFGWGREKAEEKIDEKLDEIPGRKPGRKAKEAVESIDGFTKGYGKLLDDVDDIPNGKTTNDESIEHAEDWDESGRKMVDKTGEATKETYDQEFNHIPGLHNPLEDAKEKLKDMAKDKAKEKIKSLPLWKRIFGGTKEPSFRDVPEFRDPGPDNVPDWPRREH